jgi:tetratricopeptide (TPR) repeat protein
LEAFGTTLRRHRLEAGLSLRVLARRLGLSGHGGLVDYEFGRRLLPADLLSACEEVFGDTGGELRRLWQAVHVGRSQSVKPKQSAPSERVVPFPAGLADFAGRDWELAELESLLDHRSDRAPSVIVVSGPPGVGKTSIAVHLAHRLASSCPDSLLYVDLRGAADPPLDPAAALGRLLRGVGVRPAAIPAELEDRSALLRGELYSRRALLLLDDAADEDQVRPLLPAGHRNIVIITSRSSLAGLASAHHLLLKGLRPPAAVELFTAIVGAARVLAEPAAADEIVRHCGLLPLAIRIAAARLAQWPAASLAAWAELLADTGQRLDQLEAGDRAVRSVFSTCYLALPEPARCALRRLALVPGPNFDEQAAAAVTGQPRPTARKTLATLANVGLVQADGNPGRYRFHDLIGLFAHERLAGEDDAATRECARHDLVTWALSTADEAGKMLDPSGFTQAAPNGPHPSVPAAIRWLDNEFATVVGALRIAAGAHQATLVFPLLLSLPWYLDLRYQWESMRELGEHGLAVARELGDTHQETFALNCLGLALRELGSLDEAARCSEHALTLAMTNGDEMEQATSHYRLGATLIALNRAADAIPHLETAIRLNDEHQQPWDLASSINRLGLALRALGRYTEAAALHQQALTIFESIDAIRSAGMARTHLGFTLSELGRHTDAATQHACALAHFRDGHDEWGQALARYGLGTVAVALDNPAEAAEHLRLSALLFGNQNDPRRQAQAIELLTTLEKAERSSDSQRHEPYRAEDAGRKHQRH